MLKVQNSAWARAGAPEAEHTPLVQKNCYCFGIDIDCKVSET